MSKKVALSIMFFLLSAILVFHIAIIIELIPFDKVWAGKLDSIDEMRKFETFSILMNALMLTIFFFKYRLLIKGERNKLVDVFIWFFAGIFALNTLGNLFAQSMIELIFGTLFTLVSSILCVIIVKKEKSKLS